MITEKKRRRRTTVEHPIPSKTQKKVSGIEELKHHGPDSEPLRPRNPDLADLLPQSVLEMDISGNITYANKAALETFGYTIDDLKVGITPFQLVESFEAERVALDIERVLGGDPISGTEYSARKKNGQAFPVSVHAHRMMQDNELTGISGILIDLTERRSFEANLKEERERYDALFNRSHDSVIVLDFNGHILDANSPALSMLGYSREELGQKKFSDIVAENDVDLCLDRMRDLVATGSQPNLVKFTMNGNNGRQVLVSARSCLLYRGEKPYAIMCIPRDVTEIYRLQEELEREKVLSAAGTSAAEAAHEIKNALTKIGLTIDVIRMRLGNDEKLGPFLSECNDALEKADRLARQMMMLSAPTQKMEDVRTDRFMANIMMHLGSGLLAKNPNIQLKNEIQRDLPTIRADRNQLEQAINNILINAIEAMPDGGLLSVLVENGAMEDGRKAVRILISDSGCGISEDKLGSIFKPFFTTKGARGNGLGLAITWKMVNNHHGKINVESEVGKGTSFEIILPIA